MTKWRVAKPVPKTEQRSGQDKGADGPVPRFVHFIRRYKGTKPRVKFYMGNNLGTRVTPRIVCSDGPELRFVWTTYRCLIKPNTKKTCMEDLTHAFCISVCCHSPYLLNRRLSGPLCNPPPSRADAKFCTGMTQVERGLDLPAPDTPSNCCALLFHVYRHTVEFLHSAVIRMITVVHYRYVWVWQTDRQSTARSSVTSTQDAGYPIPGLTSYEERPKRRCLDTTVK